MKIFSSLSLVRFSRSRPAESCRSRRRVEPYWRYEDVALAGLANPVSDEREGVELLEQTLRQAVALQLVADVPVGAFLSGGIDSSTIVALMQAQSSRKVKTFTVGFDEAGFDEAPHAKAVARHLGTDHCEIRVTPNETRAVIPKFADNVRRALRRQFANSDEHRLRDRTYGR